MPDTLFKDMPHSRYRVRQEFLPELLTLLSAHVGRCTNGMQHAQECIDAGQVEYGQSLLAYYKHAAKYVTAMMTEVLSSYRHAELAFAHSAAAMLVESVAAGWTPGSKIPLRRFYNALNRSGEGRDIADGTRSLGPAGEGGSQLVDATGTGEGNRPHHGGHPAHPEGGKGTGPPAGQGGATRKGGGPKARANHKGRGR